MRFATLGLIAIAFAAAAGAARADMALPADTGAAASAPINVLSDSDVATYRQAFAAAREGRIEQARSLAARASDPVLTGYVLGEAYLAGGGATLSDLIEWMRAYPELPIADRIYRLGVSRASKRVHKRHHKVVLVMIASVPVPSGPAHKRGGGYEQFDDPDPPLSSPAGQSARGQIEAYIKADQPDQAAAVLGSAAANGASDYDVARLTSRVAASYMTEGEDQQAYDTAMRVQGPIRQAVPTLDWYAGFSAFRLGNYAQSAAQLEILAQSGSVPNYLRSQAAFWAARAHLRDGDPQRVITLLQAAAREKPTFYGLLAERMLGQDTENGFRDPILTSSDIAAIGASSSGRRALALLQLGEDRAYAGQELNRSFGESDGSHDEGYAALARRVDNPNLELRASETTASRNASNLLTGLFPVPQYRPDGGYTLDPALVLAFTRAESRFMADALSHAGARGLMQLMPSAAIKFGGAGAVASLGDPTYNMSLGQRYLALLLDSYGGNLVYVPGAYNAGTGRVTGWVNARSGKEDDALIFIESIRISETRYYVKRVLMYHWMYERRMGEKTPSLDDVVQGNWPIYHPPIQPPAPPPPAPPPQTPPDNTVVSDARY
ncbi:MAG TPA: lytic transglycosylase domain-containing protein [Rhizomicrobium sp.]|nr:lytic transglycosylase domain-containing protein [Rhizomicrobium sp.]